jgi:hypothetical protein
MTPNHCTSRPGLCPDPLTVSDTALVLTVIHSASDYGQFALRVSEKRRVNPGGSLGLRVR